MSNQGIMGHPEDCMCQDCIDNRFNASGKKVDEKQAIANGKPLNADVNYPEINKATTLKELYKARRNGSKSIWGTALGLYSAFYEWFLIKILWDRIISRIFPNTIHPILSVFLVYHLYKVKITDGYALVLLALPLLSWWIICTCLMIITSALFLSLISIVVAIHVILFIPFPILAIIYIPVSIYSIVFEIPASCLNRDFNKKDNTYSVQVENSFKTKLSHIPFGWLIFTFVVIVGFVLGGIFWSWVGVTIILGILIVSCAVAIAIFNS